MKCETGLRTKHVGRIHSDWQVGCLRKPFYRRGISCYNTDLDQKYFPNLFDMKLYKANGDIVAGVLF